MSNIEPRPFVYRRPFKARKPKPPKPKYTPAQLKLRSIKGLIQDYRAREMAATHAYEQRLAQHPNRDENSRKNKGFRSYIQQLKLTAEYLAAYAAILEGLGDL